jgi:hypothetical protein
MSFELASLRTNGVGKGNSNLSTQNSKLIWFGGHDDHHNQSLLADIQNTMGLVSGSEDQFTRAAIAGFCADCEPALAFHDEVQLIAACVLMRGLLLPWLQTIGADEHAWGLHDRRFEEAFQVGANKVSIIGEQLHDSTFFCQ